jgi:prepilin-type N-terminal cleavage/methylation domain-containing protein
MKKAFSLIEIAVVILIIGLIIAGIASAGNLSKKARLQSARSLTNSSPVNLIDGLTLWLETTSEESFETKNIIDNASINKWVGINKRRQDGNATQINSVNQPKYAIKGINELPALSFNGSSSYFNLPDGVIPFGDSSYTIFIVSKPEGTGNQTLVFGGSYGVNYSCNSIRYNGNGQLMNYWWGTGVFTTINLPSAGQSNVISFTYNTTSSIIDSYINGSIGTPFTTTTDRISPSTNNLIGVRGSTGAPAGDWMQGKIGEIIIFDRNLEDDERKDVELYLSKKWRIPLKS